jgi:hypothetical protein
MDTPNLMVKTYNYLKAVSKRVDATTYYDRAYICSRCPHLTPDVECSICGCPIETKAAWKTEKCPKGKWKNL